MLKHRKIYADVPSGQYSPLECAIGARDGNVVQMVEQAVRQRQTLLAFQPVMQAHPPHQTAFYEGLIRVLDSTGRVVPARDFLPVVETTELGREIDCAALEAGLRTLIQNPSVRLSLNMSARSIGYKRWMNILSQHLNKDQTLGERLMLEISESSATTIPELVIDFMDRLQERNIGFALDDFGGGLTAFKNLRDFFFDAVKIDSQFVHGVHANPDNQSVVKALVAVAKQFDMLIIANRVETVEDAEFLVANGVDCLQGFLFGTPTVRPPWLLDRDSATG